MNVTSIELWSNLDYTTGATNKKHATLSLSNVSYTDSYLIKSVSGLDNAEIVPNYYGTGNGILLAYQYYAMVPPPRVVTFLIKLNPQSGQTVGSLRDELNKMISYTRRGTIEIKFKNGSTHVASLFGLVTKFESSIFTSEAEVQITFTCDYPFLKGPSFIELVGTYAVTIPTQPNLYDYESTAPHGFRMQIQFTGLLAPLTQFTIQGIYGQTVAPFTINYTFNNGDNLYINSEEENKSVYVVRSGVTTYLADKLSSNSIWPIMFPGENTLGISTIYFNWVSLKYKTLYWGI